MDSGDSCKKRKKSKIEQPHEERSMDRTEGLPIVKKNRKKIKGDELSRLDDSTEMQPRGQAATEKKKQYKKAKKVPWGEKSAEVGDESEKKMKRVMEDERFASTRRDPRFRRIPIKEQKVALDPRFAALTTSRDFAASSAPVDKRGRRRQSKDASDKELLRHYFYENDMENRKKQEGQASSDRELTEDENDELSSLSEESSSSSDDEDDSDEDEVQIASTDISQYLMANHDDTPTIEKETHRLAVVNMDWVYIKAVDIFMLMRSGLPKGGEILSVTVYPSEFGLKCMRIEAEKGPAALIEDFNDGNEDDLDANDEKLRTYELNKLRYYHAVVVCDSSETASHLYNTLDGTSLLGTSNVLDLRFIPDSTEFNHPPRDVATEVPVDYKEPEFEIRALQHSKVKLTWDDDLPERKKILRRKFNPDKLNEEELNRYLVGSDDSDSETMDDEELDGGKDDIEDYIVDTIPQKELKREKEREKYLSFMNTREDQESTEKDDVDLEITFKPDLENLSESILKKKNGKSETVWEELERKRKEKRKSRKQGSVQMSGATSPEESDYSDDFFAEDDSDVENILRKNGKKFKDNRSTKETGNSSEEMREREACKEELELLVGDSLDVRHGVSNDDNNKNTKGAKRKRKDKHREDKLPEVDPSSDPRFALLLHDPDFALDPTDPQYKRSVAYLRKRSEKQKTRRGRAEDINEMESLKTDGSGVSSGPDRSLHTKSVLDKGIPQPNGSSEDNSELSQIIRSLKLRSGGKGSLKTDGSVVSSGPNRSLHTKSVLDKGILQPDGSSEDNSEFSQIIRSLKLRSGGKSK